MKAHLVLLPVLAALAGPAAAQQLPDPVPANPPAAAPAQGGTPEATPPAQPAAPAQQAQPAVPAQPPAPAAQQGTGPGLAQLQAPRSEPCYTIVPPPQGLGLGPDGSVMLDRCSGKTWLLIRIAIPNDQGEMTGDFTYRCEPILYGDREALLSSPPPAPKPAPAPAPATKKKR